MVWSEDEGRSGESGLEGGEVVKMAAGESTAAGVVALVGWRWCWRWRWHWRGGAGVVRVRPLAWEEMELLVRS